jgi:hypothetical protein
MATRAGPSSWRSRSLHDATLAAIAANGALLCTERLVR